MTREADANETLGELVLALPGNIVGESQFRMSIEVSQYVGVCRHHQMIQRLIVSSCERACWGYVDVGKDQVCVSQHGCNSQLLQMRICQSICMVNLASERSLLICESM